MKTARYHGEEYKFESLNERENRLKKIAHDLFEQCQSYNITVKEFYQVLENLKEHMEENITVSFKGKEGQLKKEG